MRHITIGAAFGALLLWVGSASAATSFSTGGLSCSASSICQGGTFFDQSNGMGGVNFSTTSAFQTIVGAGNQSYDLTLQAQGIASGSNTPANTLIPFGYVVSATVTGLNGATASLVGYQVDFNIQRTNPVLQSVFSSPVTTGLVSFGPNTLSGSASGFLSQLTNAALMAGENYLLTAHVKFQYNVIGASALFQLGASHLDVQSAPEPGTIALMGAGLAALAARARRWKK